MEGRGGRGRDCPRFFSYYGFSATVTGQVGKEMDIPFCAGQAVREEKAKSNIVAELGPTKLGSNPSVATDCCVVGAKRTRGQPETAPSRMRSSGSQCLDHCTNHQ